jgi:membrane protease YdiL (CAAX protease family)
METPETEPAQPSYIVASDVVVVEDLPRPTPSDPPWNSWAAIAVWVFSVLAILIFPAVFLLPYLARFRDSFGSDQELIDFAQSDPTAVLLQVGAVIPAHLITFFAAWLVATRVRTYRLGETLGFRSGGVRWWHYLAILVAFFAMAAVVQYYVPEQDNQLLRVLRSSRAAVFLVAFLATFTAPIVEEMVYRGLLFSAFQRSIGVHWAFVLVSFLFALVHFPQYLESPSTLLLLGVLSLVLTAVRVYSGNLLPCIILHTAFNGLQSLLLVLEPYIEQMQPQTETAVALFFLDR